LEETTGKRWLWRILDFINPLRDPSLTVAAVLTFIEEAGQHEQWYWIVVIALVNWLAVRGVVWLVVNFTFASTFIARRIWWAIRHPRLAWRILDAVGHEEIIIGGLPSLSDTVLLQDGSGIMSPMLGASGIQIVGELPPGTQIPALGMPGGQISPDLAAFANNGFFPGMNMNAIAPGPNSYPNTPPYSGLNASANYATQRTDELPRSFPQRPSADEERLRQQMEAYKELLDDWIQYTEEKWRTVSDSQLGWKPLRGRWGSWTDIFQDVYAAKTSDPMAEAAQSAGEATGRRFETSKEKGSAASAVACFMRDMMTLRRGIDLLQQQRSGSGDVPTPPQRPAQPQPQNPSFNKRYGAPPSVFGNPNSSGLSSRSLIRRPAPMFVDADTDKK